MQDRSEWLRGLLGRSDVPKEVKRAVLELHPWVDSGWVSVATAGELGEELADREADCRVWVVWACPPIDTESAG